MGLFGRMSKMIVVSSVVIVALAGAIHCSKWPLGNGDLGKLLMQNNIM